MFKYILLLFAIFGLFSCSETNQPTDTQFKGFAVPSNFPQPTYDLAKNPVTEAGFNLGKKLFYDEILSLDGTIACASCHIQTSAFTQHGHDLSHGINDLLTLRNTPPVQNMAWKRFFMWDGGVFDLDLFAIAPITAHNEMGETLANVLGKLRNHSSYPGLFEKAFGSKDITTERFLKALSQFQLLCISADSKYDKVIRKEGVQFTQDELAGYTVFLQKCESCHKEPLFTNEKFVNNGLSIRNAADKGRAMITLNPMDEYKFIVPSLRNVAETQPYMHDGSIRTLSGVLDHYSNGMIDSPTLDSTFRNPNGLGIPLTDEDKRVLLAFLQTLTDQSFLKNPMLSAP
jgi:cytochrome c peroxidase